MEIIENSHVGIREFRDFSFYSSIGDLAFRSKLAKRFYLIGLNEEKDNYLLDKP